MSNIKIYDCFTFFNELDLLEIRLNELDPIVDFFVLVEATFTHQNGQKPLYFQLNKDRFSKFVHKIIHIIISDIPDKYYECEDKTWILENHQRRGILKGLEIAKPEDIIIISDIDEIPKLTSIIENRHLFQKGLSVLGLSFFLYFFNTKVKKHVTFQVLRWSLFRFFSSKYKIKFFNHIFFAGPVIGQKRLMTDPQNWRNIRESLTVELFRIPDAGWHFSYLGGVEGIVTKLNALNVEFDYNDFKDKEYLRNKLKSLKNIFPQPFDVTLIKNHNILPKYILNNKLRFEAYFYNKEMFVE